MNTRKNALHIMTMYTNLSRENVLNFGSFSYFWLKIPVG